MFVLTFNIRPWIKYRDYLFTFQNALYKSTHIDENDVQTISHVCYVLSFKEYKKRRKLDQKHIYYFCAGTYDPTSGLVTENYLESSEINLSWNLVPIRLQGWFGYSTKMSFAQETEYFKTILLSEWILFIV